MRPATRFRDTLTRRLLSIATGSAVLSPLALAGCGGTVIIDDGSGGAGGGHSTSSSVHGSTHAATTGATTSAAVTTAAVTVGASTTGSGSMCGTGVECFVLPGTSCPSQQDAFPYFPVCTNDGCYVETVDSGPTANGDLCCYEVTETFCGIGRPFMIDGQAKIAIVARSETQWIQRGIAPECADLGDRERALLADAWMRDALLEHASVAAFARFALELLAHGAPPELVAGAHRAALDEIEHAGLCFALASAFAGEPLSPARFDAAATASMARDLAALAVSAFEEGCVGETIASLVAAEQLELASDPTTRSVLAKIADDEARHAELAWRTVAWAIRMGGPEVSSAIRGSTAKLEARASRATTHDTYRRPSLERYGWLAPESRAAIFGRRLCDVVLPCAAAMLDGAAPRTELRSATPSA
jgi:hypothetical protein